MDELKIQNENLKKEITELRELLIAGETLRSQYVLCCALNVKPEIIMQYVKGNETKKGWIVLDNGKPAINTSKSLPGQNYFYTEFESALEYAKKWLGIYSDSLPEDWQGEIIEYNLYGDKIEIRFTLEVE